MYSTSCILNYCNNKQHAHYNEYSLKYIPSQHVQGLKGVEGTGLLLLGAVVPEALGSISGGVTSTLLQFLYQNQQADSSWA